MMSYEYKEISEKDVPSDVRFDVPRRNQGQMVEYAFGGFDRGEHDDGDPYMRVIDSSDRSRKFFKRVDVS